MLVCPGVGLRGFFLAALCAVICRVPPVMAADLRVAVGFSTPPYIFPDEDRGIEFDIVREALAQEGHRMVAFYLPPGRAALALENGQADAATTQRPDSGLDAQFSDVYVSYRNYAITLASRKMELRGFGDLAGKSVLAFQQASIKLGPEFHAAVEANPAYREDARQIVHPGLLFHGRVDVVIADRNIFSWFANASEVKNHTDTMPEVRYHPLFPPTEYRMAFRDGALRDSFNRGLAKLRASGEYARIFERYSSYVTAP